MRQVVEIHGLRADPCHSILTQDPPRESRGHSPPTLNQARWRRRGETPPSTLATGRPRLSTTTEAPVCSQTSWTSRRPACSTASWKQEASFNARRWCPRPVTPSKTTREFHQLGITVDIKKRTPHASKAFPKILSIPTLSRSFAAASFQLTPVGSSILTVIPPNPSACPRVGVWDKPWDKSANYFETASPQFHFCPGDKTGWF